MKSTLFIAFLILLCAHAISHRHVPPDPSKSTDATIISNNKNAVQLQQKLEPPDTYKLKIELLSEMRQRAHEKKMKAAEELLTQEAETKKTEDKTQKQHMEEEEKQFDKDLRAAERESLAQSNEQTAKLRATSDNAQAEDEKEESDFKESAARRLADISDEEKKWKATLEGQQKSAAELLQKKESEASQKEAAARQEDTAKADEKKQEEAGKTKAEEDLKADIKKQTTLTEQDGKSKEKAATEEQGQKAKEMQTKAEQAEKEQAQKKEAAEKEQAVKREQSEKEQAVKAEQYQKKSTTVRWENIGQLCFNARGGYGSVTLQGRRNIRGLRLTYTGGAVTCSGGSYSHWGCGGDWPYISIIIANHANSIIAPTSNTIGFSNAGGPGPDRCWYTLSGYGPNSGNLDYVVPSNQWLYQTSGTEEIRVFYGEAYHGWTTGDNNGASCASVSGYMTEAF